jgi:hypothetical protein
MYRLQIMNEAFARLVYVSGLVGPDIHSLDTTEERDALLKARDILNSRGGSWHFVVTGELFSNGDARNISMTTRWDKESCFTDVDAALRAAQPRTQVFTPIDRYR